MATGKQTYGTRRITIESNDPAHEDLEDALHPLDAASTVFDDLRDDTINAIINEVADGVQNVSGYSEYWVNIDTPNHTQQFRDGDTVAFQENVDTRTWVDPVLSIIRDDPALNDYDEDVTREIAEQLVRAAMSTTVEELPRKPDSYTRGIDGGGYVVEGTAHVKDG